MIDKENAPSAKKAVSTARIHVKLKRDLKRELEKKAADNFMSLSQLLLQSARKSTITVKFVEPPKLSKELMVMTAAYNKFGSQLNMLAKHCNTYKENSDTLRILTALLDIERSIAELKAETLGEP